MKLSIKVNIERSGEARTGRILSAIAACVPLVEKWMTKQPDEPLSDDAMAAQVAAAEFEVGYLDGVRDAHRDAVKDAAKLSDEVQAYVNGYQAGCWSVLEALMVKNAVGLSWGRHGARSPIVEPPQPHSGTTGGGEPR
jgi:hypothetical protein